MIDSRAAPFIRVLRIVAVAIAVLVALLAWQVAAPVSGAAQQAKAQDAESKSPFSPIIVSLVPQKRIVPVLGSDNRYHVLYELALTNTLGGDANLHSVEVIDAGSKKTLLRLSVNDILKGEYLHTLDRQTAKTITFARFEARVLILNLSFDAKKSVPGRIRHRFEVSGADPFDKKQRVFRYLAAPLKIAKREPPELLPPLGGKGWLASDGCCGPTGHVDAMIGLNGRLQAAERFAIDWIKIDADGRVFNGDKNDVKSWAGYGAKVFAAGAGKVIAVRDGMADHAPGKMPDNLSFADLPGNHVVVAMAGGFSAFYAHLKPGSIKVKVGDKVKAGEVIGAVGNNGGSLAPHLHFHIVDGPSGATSDGYPYVLRSFQLAATADPSALMKLIEGQPALPRDQLNPAPRKRQLPLNFDIIDFPAARDADLPNDRSAQ